MTDKITIERETLQSALDAIDSSLWDSGGGVCVKEPICIALRAALEAQPVEPVASYGEIESACRHAFEIEDGYGDPDSNPQRYRIFHDGFFAARVSAQPAPAAVQPDERIEKALRRAFDLGQTYWRQVDSDYTSEHKKSDVTRERFESLVTETIAAAGDKP